MAVKFRLEFYESERGWGSDVWYNYYDTLDEALAARDECNRDNSGTHVPEYYIIARDITVVDV